MADPSKPSRPTPGARRLSSEEYARLRAEAKAPYRGLRKFVYFAFGASGLIGAFIFFMQIIARRDVAAALPNFALQMGVVGLMVWLFRLERRAEDKQR